MIQFSMVQTSQPKKHFDAVIFDIDNVIIDTRFSYTDCIRETVQTYLEQILGFKPSKTALLSQSDVEQLKLLGGFNDDWDTCYGLLLYLLSLKPKSSSIAALKKKVNLKNFSNQVRTPLSVQAMEQRCGRHTKVSLPRIVLLFQKLYWSKYIKRESLVIPKSIFQQMADRGIKLGIATGRNRREAGYVLNRFGISKFIHGVVTTDELPATKFKKPHPYALLRLAQIFGKHLRYLYIGDLPDDMLMTVRAANKIEIVGWGFSFLSADPEKMKKALKKAGAKKVVRTALELRLLLRNC